ncbi:MULTISPECIES: helix-turn-helix domain-containing protein [unclassified Streptomyces]|uniref:helix-turn-helix domain-containing protein n=1 Tax=unclassified Streptomyces TaxID=2593676 RepID=UPI000FFE94DE|nr:MULTISPECIES: helix-turn-helix domain-containing protein [unclassified Streptomyces]
METEINFDTLAERAAYERARLTGQVRASINRRMQELQIIPKDLARRMGVTQGRVSQILTGGENLTIGTIASVAAALGTHFKIELISEEAQEGAPPDVEELVEEVQEQTQIDNPEEVAEVTQAAVIGLAKVATDRQIRGFLGEVAEGLDEIIREEGSRSEREPRLKVRSGKKATPKKRTP